MQLKNKVILITGSSTGIGEAIARRFIAEGAKVMVHGRDEDRAKAVCDELGSNSQYVIADVANPESCETLVKATIEEFGEIHGLVNNAAVTTRSNLETSDVNMFDTIVAINLRAPLLLSRAAVKAFRQQKTGGNILNIGSLNAYCGQTDLLVYSITKGGMMTMTRNLGDALGPENIRVNQINVGWTLTANEEKLKEREGFQHGWETRLSKTFAPSGRLLHPEDIAWHALFWMSDHSAPVNGNVCDVEQYPLPGRNLISKLSNI